MCSCLVVRLCKKKPFAFERCIGIVVHTVGVNDQRLAKLKADVQRLDRLSVDPKVHHGPPTGSVFNLFQEVGFF